MHGGGQLGDAFEGLCALCGEPNRFVKDERPTRESYTCSTCKGSLRYQGQARAVLDRYSRHGSESIKELITEPEFRALRIWEPGDLGPFRRYLPRIEGYQRTGFEPGAQPGELRDGIRHEDLMGTTFRPDSFDLIITSDIFEHVRKPALGFREVFRVLRPGGAHIFTIPVMAPIPATTVERVDTSGPEDVLVLEARHHKVHLVYNDFGEDLLPMLADIGFETQVLRFDSTSENASRLVTFSSVKPAKRRRRFFRGRVRPSG